MEARVGGIADQNQANVVPMSAPWTGRNGVAKGAPFSAWGGFTYIAIGGHLVSLHLSPSTSESVAFQSTKEPVEEPIVDAPMLAH